jgi:hypothetical protein
MLEITMTKTKFSLKDGTKTVYIPIENEKRVISEEYYNNIIDAAPFMRRLGGSETLQRCYTCAGYRVFKIISKSPDRENKSVYEFDFKYI